MEKVGRYQVRELLGEGAMAKVFKAYDPDIDRELAIKFLKSQLRGDSEYHIRFLFVRPALCLRLPPDSQSPATPLPFG